MISDILIQSQFFTADLQLLNFIIAQKMAKYLIFFI